MALTDIALCSRALLMIGANSIASFDEGTAESEVAASLFPSVRDALLSLHPWNFATRKEPLARLFAEPEADHAHAFQLPEGCLRVLSAGQGARGRGLDYAVIGRQLHCDAEAATLTFVRRVPEPDFPAFFDQALIARLAFEFCLPLTESTSRAEFLRKVAEDELRRARGIDAQEDAPRAIEDFTLVGVRA